MSILPNSLIAALAIALTCAETVTSVGTIRHLRPVFLTASAVSSSCDWVRDAATMSAPALGEPHRHRAAQSAAGAGDDRDFAVELERIENHCVT